MILERDRFRELAMISAETAFIVQPMYALALRQNECREGCGTASTS